MAALVAASLVLAVAWRLRARAEMSLESVGGARVAVSVLSAGEGRQEQGAEGIWVADAGQSSFGHITDDQPGPGNLSWSPDGANLAYTSRRALCVVGADGADKRVLLPSTARKDPSGPTWSPDGRQVAVARHATDIGVVDADFPLPDEARVRVLVSSSESGCGWPAWSPDGDEIALSQPGVGRLAVFDIGTRQVRTLLEGRAGDSWIAAWSPDGRRIAAVRWGWGASSLYVVTCDSGEAARIERVTPALCRPAWSADGLSVVYARRGRLWVVPSGGGAPCALAGIAGLPPGSSIEAFALDIPQPEAPGG